MTSSHSKLHYRPPKGYFGDTIPFYWNGEYHVFYLEGQVDPYRRVRFTPFNHLVSTDLVNWEELPVAIPLGDDDAVDMSLGTGTVIRHDGRFWFLYCGRRFNPTREVVCLATSDDLIHWDKHPGNPILVPDGERYALTDFRDPFPFWNPEEQRYWMVIASKLADPGTPRPGCLALAVSDNLLDWELRPPFYAPNLYEMALECPDVFKTQDRWHVIYSAHRRTVFRTATHLEGPWKAASPDSSDHLYPGIYAPKTLSDGQRRFLFGWLWTRQENRDLGPIEWGGDMMIPRELVPLPGGEIAERCPPEHLAACGPTLETDPLFRMGDWHKEGHSFKGRRFDGLAYAALFGVPESLMAECKISFTPNTRAAGILFRASADLHQGYALRLEPHPSRVILERWNTQSQEGFSVLAERPLRLVPGESISVQLFLDGDIIEAFIDDRSSLCCRGYDFPNGEMGLFVENGEATFADVGLSLLPP